MWIVIPNLLDIDFIHGDIHGQSCKNTIFIQENIIGKEMPLMKWQPFGLILVGYDLNKTAKILQTVFSKAFFDENYWIVIQILLKFADKGQNSNWQLDSIGSGDGLVPNRWQAFTWTNADTVHWHINWYYMTI